MRARDNPFAVERVLRIRYRPLEGTWDELLERLEAFRFRAAIVGPHGSGKTTLLEDVEERLNGRFAGIRLRLDEDRPRFETGELRSVASRVTSRHLVYLDGAEQLGIWGWWRLVAATRRAGGLIITSHRPGRLATWVRCQTSPELVRTIVGQLLPPGSSISDETLNDLFDRHNGNVRNVLRELYDWSAGRMSPPRPALSGPLATR